MYFAAVDVVLDKSDVWQPKPKITFADIREAQNGTDVIVVAEGG